VVELVERLLTALGVHSLNLGEKRISYLYLIYTVGIRKPSKWSILPRTEYPVSDHPNTGQIGPDFEWSTSLDRFIIEKISL
jgi:hypothetical protein